MKDVEVKGTSGDLPCFIITAGEIAQARNNSRFELFVVTNALEKTRRLHRYSGSEFLAQYRLDPLQYRAVCVS